MGDESADADDDLLERARRLCLAAQEISASLPTFATLGAGLSRAGEQRADAVAALADSNTTRQRRGKTHVAANAKPRDPSTASKSASRQQATQRQGTQTVLSTTGISMLELRVTLCTSMRLAIDVASQHDSTPSSQASCTLPPAAAAQATVPPLTAHKRTLAKPKPVQRSSNSSSNSNNNQESLPDIGMSDEQRKAREAEKIRHAQERARARVTRTNQCDQLEAERASELKRQQQLRAQEERAEREQLAEQSRQRAEDRIRLKRQLSASASSPAVDRPQSLYPERPATDSAKLERFRRKTLARLHAYVVCARATLGCIYRTDLLRVCRLTASLSSSSSDTTAKRAAPQQVPEDIAQPAPERDEDAEAEARRQKEKRLRQETAERIQRHRALEEEQRRAEQELIHQGLLQYKNRQKELDRVAKGLAPKKTSVAPISTQPTNGSCVWTNTPCPEQPESTHIEPAAPSPPSSPSVDIPSERQCAPEAAAPECESDTPADNLHATGSEDSLSSPPPLALLPIDHAHASAASGGKRKVPPWKRAPVPVLPAEFYSCKAIIPATILPESLAPQQAAAAPLSSSYTEKFRSRIPDVSTTNAPSQPSSRDGSTGARVSSATRIRAQELSRQSRQERTVATEARVLKPRSALPSLSI